MAKKTTLEKIVAIPSLNRVMSEINRQQGKDVMFLGKNLLTNFEVIPTGIAKLDNVLAKTYAFDKNGKIQLDESNLPIVRAAGFPKGRIVELYGIPSSGKSLIALLTIKQAQLMGLDCVYIDAEGSFDAQWARLLGVDTDKLVLMTKNTAEDVFDIIAYIEKAQPGVIVIDSVAALVTTTEMEASFKDNQMAILARLMSKAIKKINMLNKKTLFIFINQLRDTLVMYGAKETTPGGRALAFYASVRLKVHQPSEKIYKDGKKTGEVIGQQVQFNLTKSKVSSPYRQGMFKLYYENALIEE